MNGSSPLWASGHPRNASEIQTHLSGSLKNVSFARNYEKKALRFLMLRIPSPPIHALNALLVRPSVRLSDNRSSVSGRRLLCRFYRRTQSSGAGASPNRRECGDGSVEERANTTTGETLGVGSWFVPTKPACLCPVDR